MILYLTLYDCVGRRREREDRRYSARISQVEIRTSIATGKGGRRVGRVIGEGHQILGSEWCLET